MPAEQENGSGAEMAVNDGQAERIVERQVRERALRRIDGEVFDNRDGIRPELPCREPYELRRAGASGRGEQDGKVRMDVRCGVAELYRRLSGTYDEPRAEAINQILQRRIRNARADQDNGLTRHNQGEVFAQVLRSIVAQEDRQVLLAADPV